MSINMANIMLRLHLRFSTVIHSFVSSMSVHHPEYGWIFNSISLRPRLDDLPLILFLLGAKSKETLPQVCPVCELDVQKDNNLSEGKDMLLIFVYH